jgi:hypothetical protein
MGLWRRIDSIFTAVTVTDTYQTVNLSIIQYKDPFFKEGVYDEAADWAVVYNTTLDQPFLRENLMRNATAIQMLSQFFWYPRKEEGYSKSSLYLVGGMVLFLVTVWLGGCSSPPKSTSDPSKQEVQTDSDRFFKNLEKEETKKEAKEANP